MQIRITEANGIKQHPYGHLQHNEVREVDDQFGAFACANGWAEDVGGTVPTGERGSLDLTNPADYQPGE